MNNTKTRSVKPYRPPFFEVGTPYINRIVPKADSIYFEWCSHIGKCKVYYRQIPQSDFMLAGESTDGAFEIKNLLTNYDFEFYITDKNGISMEMDSGSCDKKNLTQYPKLTTDPMTEFADYCAKHLK